MPKAKAIDTKPQRIAKVIARAGVCSRREAERLIGQGAVSVNGKKLTSPAINVLSSDSITVNGESLPQASPPRLWRYYKPKGRVTSHRDPEGRPTVFEALPETMPRVISIGRLDFNTEGLLLLTTHGGLARHLELPSTGWLRRYRVRANGRTTQQALDKLKEGITIDGIRYGPVDATLERAKGANLWLTMGLREGKNREIRRILTELGLLVNRLIRISYGPFVLGDLEVGAVAEIKGRAISDQLGTAAIQELGLGLGSKGKDKRQKR